MNEYVTMMKYLYPDNYLPRIIKNKTDLLADYRSISNYRSRAFNYQLEEEKTDFANATAAAPIFARSSALNTGEGHSSISF